MAAIGGSEPKTELGFRQAVLVELLHVYIGEYCPLCPLEV